VSGLQGDGSCSADIGGRLSWRPPCFGSATSAGGKYIRSCTGCFPPRAFTSSRPRAPSGLFMTGHEKAPPSGLAFASTRWPVGKLIGERCMRATPEGYGWKSLESAPVDEDVSLQVTDGHGKPYILVNASTAAGCVSSNKGTPLAVTPLMWRPYFRPRSRRPR
jgi:hypothetical protein